MIMKILGSILIIIAGTMSGFCLGNQLRMQLSEMKNFRKILIMIQGEIRYNNSMLSEALTHISRHTQSSFGTVLEIISQKMNDMPGETFEAIWKEEMQRNSNKFHLKKKHYRIILELGENLGYLDKEMQINTLEMIKNQFNLEIQSMEQSINNNVKLCNYVGVMAGILIVLIIV